MVYGTIVVMATLSIAFAGESELWRLLGIVAGTSLIFWVAHLYAHGLAESIERQRRLTRQETIAVTRRELGILLAAVGPLLALLLGAIGLFQADTAVWLAFAVGLATLAAEGVRYARLEGFGHAGTAAVVAVNLALGLIVVGLKVAISH